MTPLLAQRLRADRSFERVYRRHLGDVYRYAVAVLRNPADAEDVTQTTFLNAYRAYQRGERPRNPHNWLIAIAHNVCRQRFRQSQRRPDEVAFDDRIAQIVPEEEPDGPTVHDIQRALGHLAFNQRTALVMRELEGRSYAEIGEILGLSTSAVETLIFRARRALREQLEGTLTCAEAERAISLQADGKLGRNDRGPLRAHLRECRECERVARSQRAQRRAFKALGAIPIPTSLTSLFGGGGTAVGGGVAAKAAAMIAAGAVATGVGYEGAKVVRESAPTPASASNGSAVEQAHAARVAALKLAAVSAVEERRAVPRASTALPSPRAAKTVPARAKGGAKATAQRAAAPGRAKKAAAPSSTGSPRGSIARSKPKPTRPVTVAPSRATAKAKPTRPATSRPAAKKPKAQKAKKPRPVQAKPTGPPADGPSGPKHP